MPRDTAARSQPDHGVGSVVAGRYVLLRQLGRASWLAHCQALDVDVVLKLLPFGVTSEALSAARLEHPAVVRVIDFGSTELAEPFLVTERLDGQSLRELLRAEGRLPAERAAALLLPLLDGLGMAHEKGLRHGDITPENIFIATDTGRTQPKLLDFGIARAADASADICAIGAVLYEMLAGHLSASLVSLTELGVADEQLWRIIDRCLKPRPEERWASTWELGEALALWLFEHGVRVDAAARSLRQGWLESGLSGVRMVVASDAPGPPSMMPPSLEHVLKGSFPADEPRSGTRLRSQPRIEPAPRSHWGFAAAGLVILAGTASFAFMAPEGPASAKVTPRLAAAAAVVTPVPAPAPPPAVSVALPVSPPASASAPTAAAVRPQKRAVSKPKAAAPRSKTSHEFGF